MAIIRWTTATFIFEFQTIQVSDITDAYFVAKQWDNTVIEKDLTSATVDTDANTLSWTLTQAEAGLLTTGKRYSVMCDWLTSSGTRGRSKVLEGSVENSGVDEVIS